MERRMAKLLEIYTPQELRDKVSSDDFNAELCLLHAMLIITQLEKKCAELQSDVQILARATATILARP